MEFGFQRGEKELPRIVSISKFICHFPNYVESQRRNVVEEVFESLQGEFKVEVTSTASDLAKRGLLTNLRELDERDRTFVVQILSGEVKQIGTNTIQRSFSPYTSKMQSFYLTSTRLHKPSTSPQAKYGLDLTQNVEGQPPVPAFSRLLTVGVFVTSTT